MADKIKLVQGDTRPQIQLTLTDEALGTPIDITAATVRMYFRASGSTAILDTLIGVISNGPEGIVTFPWNPTTLNVAPGSYEGEVEVVFPSLLKQTMYDLLKFTVRADF